MLIVVLPFSIYSGYVQSVSPWLTLVLHDSGLGFEQIGVSLVYLSIATVSVGYGGAVLNFVASYYSGKKYVLTRISCLILVLLLVATA